METEHHHCDVLCVGGGIGGLMAAIRAAELGAKVIVAEKGNVIHSGKGGGGCDHYLCYIPEVHGADMETYLEEMLQTQQAMNFQNLGMKRIRTHLAHSFDIVQLWERWGIPMKQQGRYYFAGHAFPGGYRCLLKYEGHRQKPLLVEQAHRRKVKIVNRVMVTDLLADGRVTGAIGIDTRTEKIVTFAAKSVILGTGGLSRLYPAATPGWLANHATRLTLTGDGRMMAYRAGAELQDLEMRVLHVGPKYFARYGQATWIGVFRDPQDRPIGPFVTQPERHYGDITPEVNKAIFHEYARSGRGPVYMDGRGMSEEDYQYMMHWLVHEGNTPLIKHMQAEGIDYRRHPVEFMTYDMGCQGRIVTNEKAETSLRGLYALGDELANGVSNASVFGWLSGEHAVAYCREADDPAPVNAAAIEEKIRLVEAIRSRPEGANWREVNIALQQIMQDHAGPIRSRSLLEAGIFHLGRLREKAEEILQAANQHELVRALEVLNLIGLGELVLRAALERKETRGNHCRADYPLLNPRFNRKVQILKQREGKAIQEWREVSK